MLSLAVFAIRFGSGSFFFKRRGLLGFAFIDIS